MNSCDEIVVKTLRYLNNDLQSQELEEFRAHLQSCASCRAHLESEKALSQTLHRSRPLYSAPATLRARVSALAIEHSGPDSVEGQAEKRSSKILGKRLSDALHRILSWRILVPAAVVLALCLALVPNIERNVQAASYVETAAATHQSYLAGNVQPGLQSNSQEAVTAWFSGKVPFEFRLPAAESAPGETPVYRLTGAALVNYKGSPAALVMYETDKDKISLLVDSSTSAVVAGGNEIHFGNLTFHYHNESGFRVITWTNHGLAYALVSSVSGPAGASCLVCHQNMEDRGNFQTRR
jgi:anti-sigma factor (TIGR02949 family)